MGSRAYRNFSAYIRIIPIPQKPPGACNILQNHLYFYTKEIVFLTYQIYIAMKIEIQRRYRLFTAALVTAGIVVTSFALISWERDPGNRRDTLSGTRDTVPENRLKTGKDFDKELRQLDEARKQLDRLNYSDWPRVREDIEEVVKEIDLEKIRIQAEQAIARIDVEKIASEIESSLNSIDFNKIEQDIETALDDIQKVDREKIKQEIQKARDEVNEQLKKKEWRKEMEEVKKINLKGIEEELERARKDIVKAREELKFENLDLNETMAKARAEINNATKELNGYQEMVYSMEADGLLNTHDDYRIEYRNGGLFINDAKQSSEITGKYKKYFKEKNRTIRKKDGDIKIDSY